MSANIQLFLERFKNALGQEDSFREDLCLIVKEKTTFSLEKSCVIFKNQIVRIDSDPYLKSEIFLNKDGILEALRSKHPQKTVLDII